MLDNPVLKTVATAAAATLGRELVRGIFGTRRAVASSLNARAGRPPFE